MAKKTSDALTDQQELFCREYLKDLNLSAAYLRAYPQSSTAAARSSASDLLTNPNIQARISDLMKERQKRLDISGDRVVQRLANIAFGHLGMICVWTATGLEIKDRKDLSEEELSIIAEIDLSPVSDGDGGLLGYRKKVRMKDSLKALELLSKHLGLLDGNNDGDRKNKEAAEGRLLQSLERIEKRMAQRRK